MTERSEFKILQTSLFACLIFHVRYSSALYEHTFSHNTSAGCTERSSCSGNSSKNFSFNRNCQCDAQCVTYGDCCQDSPHFKPSPLKQCVTAGDWNTPADYKDNYYMVKSCLSTWNGEETRSRCENYTETVRQEPILGLPVTSNATSITYVNYHCARCNDDFDINKMIWWKLAVSCGKNFSLPLPEINTTMEVKYENNGKFKPKFANTSYHTCELYVWRPFRLLRKCHLKTVVTCPNSWLNETVREYCESYTSLVFNAMNTPFRNPYCATCNNVPLRQWLCEKKNMELEYGFPEMFDFFGSGDKVGRKILCSNLNEVYDPFATECRRIYVPTTVQNERYALGNCSETNLSYDLKNSSFFRQRLVDCKLHSNCTVEVNGDEQLKERENYYPNLCPEIPGDETKFNGILRKVNFLGLGISTFFLFLHLVAFAKNPALRNISDKSFASFCTALLLAYGASIIGLLLNAGETDCKVTAIITYFSYMSSFSWLLLISFEVWHTLRLSVTHLRNASGRSRRYAFIIYSVISWLALPLIFVSAALIMENQDESSFRPRFGEHICWFGSRKALLVFFGIPVFAVMLMNFYFFVSSAQMICASRVSPLNKSSKNNSNSKLFARLSLLMGLTWIMGFVAGYLDLEAVWYIYVALNSFQGFYIFLAFTLNKRVRGGYKTQVSVEKHNSIYSKSQPHKNAWQIESTDENCPAKKTRPLLS